MLGRDEFIYDDGFKLQEIKRMKHVNWDGGAGQFVYADSLLVKRTISPSHSTSHTFSYYPGGVLKEITPDKGIYYSDLMKLGKLEFNGKGQLVRSESARSFNPFIFSVTGHDAGKVLIYVLLNMTRMVCVYKNMKSYHSDTIIIKSIPSNA